jgi:glycosyltransferase involved in cell wall biosynthesis
MPFSVLMSIYHATSSSELHSCLKSLCAQQLPATQIVLVRDGPVRPEVERCIDNFTSELPFEHIFFSENRGLGPALHDGLIACDYDIVARVDSDDCSLPERFSLQTAFLSENPQISAVGSWMIERYFSHNRTSTHIRKTPVDSDSIARYARLRNPLNHPTVMLRRSHVLSSGNYQPCLMFEDYLLWIRMLIAGFRLANLPMVLVETQAGPDYFVRRGGLSYLRHELALLSKIRDLGFVSPIDALIFILTRLPVRLLPINARNFWYRTMLRK